MPRTLSIGCRLRARERSMSLWHAPLWKQLAAVWLTAVVLDALLLWIQFRRPFEVFWLIPYPPWRALLPGVVAFFRDYPLLGAALIGVPLATLAITLVLCVHRVWSLVGSARLAG